MGENPNYTLHHTCIELTSNLRGFNTEKATKYVFLSNIQ